MNRILIKFCCQRYFYCSKTRYLKKKLCSVCVKYVLFKEMELERIIFELKIQEIILYETFSTKQNSMKLLSVKENDEM